MPESYNPTYSKVEANILSVYGPHKIGVRLAAMKEQYYLFEERLNWICNNIEMVPVSGSGELHDFYYLEDEEVCLVRTATNWYRAHIIFVYKFTVGVKLVDICKELIIEDPMSLRNVVRYFAIDGVMTGQQIYRVPDTYREEILEPNAFGFWVHLSQIPIPKMLSKEIEPKIVEDLLKNHNTVDLIQRAPPLEIHLPDNDPEGSEDYQAYQKALENIGVTWEFTSMPAEISWTEYHGGDKDDPFSPTKPRTVTLSQCLYRGGHVRFEEDDILDPCDVEAPKYEEEVPPDAVIEETNGNLGDADLENLRLCSDQEEAIGDVQKRVTNEQTKNGEGKFRWLDPELPAEREFLARGTYVDNAGQIYVHLFKERGQFRRIRKLLTERFDASDPDEEEFEKYDEVIAFCVDDQKYYRGRFMEFYAGSKKKYCKVFFVDWGSVSKVDTRLVRKDVICKEIPILAFKVVLHDVLPAQGKEWSDDALNFILDKIIYDNRVMEGKMGNIIKVKTISRLNKQPLLVEILIPTPEGEYFSLSKLLKDRNEAKEASLSQVDSMEQRKLRKEYDFGVKFKKLTKTERNNLEGQVVIESTSAEVYRAVPDPDLSLLESEVSTVIKCQIVSMLHWNRLVVHLVNQGRDQTIHDLVETTMLQSCPSQNPINLVRYLCY